MMIIEQPIIEGTYIRVFQISWWERLFGIAAMRFADLIYEEIDISHLLEILENDKTDQMTYSLDGNGQPIERYDCDDFAFALGGAFHKDYMAAAMPLFLTYVRNIGHALWTFYYDGEIFVIEPQTDEIYWLPEGEWKLSLLVG